MSPILLSSWNCITLCNVEPGVVRLYDTPLYPGFPDNKKGSIQNNFLHTPLSFCQLVISSWAPHSSGLSKVIVQGPSSVPASFIRITAKGAELLRRRPVGNVVIVISYRRSRVPFILVIQLYKYNNMNFQKTQGRLENYVGKKRSFDGYRLTIPQ